MRTICTEEGFAITVHDVDADQQVLIELWREGAHDAATLLMKIGEADAFRDALHDAARGRAADTCETQTSIEQRCQRAALERRGRTNSG